MILIDAVFIHEGGGKLLLKLLLEKLKEKGVSFFVLFDRRLQNDAITSHSYLEFADGFTERSIFYFKNRSRFSTVFCLGNIPPFPFQKKSRVIVYFHSTLFLDKPYEITIKSRLSRYLKNWIFRKLVSRDYVWIVQTLRVKQRLVEQKILLPENIKVYPFFESVNYLIQNLSSTKRIKDTFLFIGNATSHKNHKLLIEAFCKLYDNEKRGTLILTVTKEYLEVFNLIEEKQKLGYPVLNMGYIENKSEIIKLYLQSEFYINPSLTESFGLTLIEAAECGCRILSCDLPYVDEVCTPSLKFISGSLDSIYEAMKYSLENQLPLPQSKVKSRLEEISNIIADDRK